MSTIHLQKNTAIVVLRGGTSSERAISLKSGTGVLQALQQAGYSAVTDVDFNGDTLQLVETLQQLKPAVVFNALHGTHGEDGVMQGLLELLNIRYTHSGVLASALAMDKAAAKDIFRSARIDTPKGITCLARELSAALPVPLPVVVKPVADGSSFGVTIVKTAQDYAKAAASVNAASRLLVEEFIPGRELTVPVLGDKALPVIEIIPKPESPFYDFASKYTDAVHADFVVPAQLPGDITTALQEAALKAHKALGCRGVSRSDFRYDPGSGRLVLLEVNSQPGMTALSLVPASAAAAGISYLDVVEFLLRAALE